MSKAIRIDKESCTKCGKCALVCPSEIMVRDKATKAINLVEVNRCIGCGHCMDVCPADSVVHSDFPAEHVHTIDYDRMPTPEQVMLLIKSRRSNRTITSKPVPAQMLEQIVEAARYAPTATNSQLLSFTLITEPEKLRQISDFTIGVFDGIAKLLLNPLVKLLVKPFSKDLYRYVPEFERLKEDHQAGKDPILRKATVLLVIHTPKSNRFGCEDANLAYQNASLMAQSLGVSQVYMGFVLTAVKQQKKNIFSEILGIDGKIQAIMALGMPAFDYPKYTDR